MQAAAWILWFYWNQMESCIAWDEWGTDWVAFTENNVFWYIGIWIVRNKH
jgi:hypothetical protein